MKPLNKNKIGEFITKLRKSRDLSLDDMGDLLYVSGRTVRRWENGEITPTMEDIINICNEFNISLEEMFEGERSIDHEVDRKMTEVSTGIDQLSDMVNSTDKTVNVLSEGVNELKEQIKLMNNEEHYRKHDDLTWFWLLLIHVIVTIIGFICYAKGNRNYITSFVSTILYIIAISFLMYRNRNNHKNLKMLFAYSVILGLNMFINIVLEINILQERELISGKPGMIRIDNLELMIVNGALYGLRHLGLVKVKLFIGLCFFIYSAWIVFCGYNLSSEKLKPAIRKAISGMKKLSSH
ncbi:MAG: helix-turn-helix transcriptional regulator [Erysipelotrichaceae bacterium]|nr:helix-turn-helix transcriptional regulator [Erysipelotrichaceae bacterium]